MDWEVHRMEQVSRDLPSDIVYRTFERWRQSGELNVLLGVLNEHAEKLRNRISNILDGLDVTDLGEVRVFGVLQGRLAETRRLRRVFEAWGKMEPTPAPDEEQEDVSLDTF